MLQKDVLHLHPEKMLCLIAAKPLFVFWKPFGETDSLLNDLQGQTWSHAALFVQLSRAVAGVLSTVWPARALNWLISLVLAGLKSVSCFSVFF